MLRLASILYSIVATSLAGIGVIAVLTTGFVAPAPIVGAALAGAVAALPVAYLIARKITNP
tara:strand:+ start:3367 stop:3549 length:183 start_codon:yes stop_codon:yes gene_type:complete